MLRKTVSIFICVQTFAYCSSSRFEEFERAQLVERRCRACVLRNAIGSKPSTVYQYHFISSLYRFSEQVNSQQRRTE